jgi:hypothetical protein
MGSSEDKVKLVEAQQTAEDALWGYKDTHGKWTAGLVQRVGAIETKQNWSLALIMASLAKVISPDILSAVAQGLKAAIVWLHG